MRCLVYYKPSCLVSLYCIDNNHGFKRHSFDRFYNQFFFNFLFKTVFLSVLTDYLRKKEVFNTTLFLYLCVTRLLCHL